MNTLFDIIEFNTDGSILTSGMPAVNSADAYDMACAEVEFTANKLKEADAVVMAAKIRVNLEPTYETYAVLARAERRSHIAKRYYENATVNRYTTKEALCADEERASAAAQAVADAIDAAEAQAVVDAIDAAEAQAVVDAIDAAEAQAVVNVIVEERSVRDEDMDTVFETFASIAIESNRTVHV